MIAPAAESDGSQWAKPKPSSVAAPKWSFRASLAAWASKAQGGRLVAAAWVHWARRSRKSRLSAAEPSAKITSAGPMRTSSSSTWPGAVVIAQKAPLASSTHASPAVSPAAPRSIRPAGFLWPSAAPPNTAAR